MDIEQITNSYRSFVSRFRIDYREEEAVWSLLSPSGWSDFTSSPDNFQSILQQQINRLNGEPYHFYRASGTFNKGSIRLKKGRIVGRTEENLKRILEVPLDADYLKYILYRKGIDPKDKKKIEEFENKLHALPDDKLAPYLDKHLELIKNFLDKAKTPYSELVRSGYGHYVKIFLEPEDQARIKEIREFHKSIVSHLNEIAGFELFDKQCTDAGTRVTRIEGSFNLKNPKISRQVYVVESNNRFYKLDELVRLLPNREKGSYSYSDSDLGVKTYEGEFPRTKIVEMINPYWSISNRQNIALSLVGFLAKLGVSWEDIEATIKDLARRNKDEETPMRLKTLETTFHRIQQGKSVKGYSGLEEIFSKEDLGMLTSLFPSTPIYVEPEGEEFMVSTDIIPEFPREAYTGIFKDYVETVGEHSETPPQFHYSGFTNYLGLRLGRTVWSAYPRRLYPNLYNCNVSITGNKKTTGIGYLYDLSEGVSQRELQILSGISSPEGIIAAFTEEMDKKTRIAIPEKQVLIIQNEITSIFKKGERQSTSTLLETLNDLYDYLPFVDIPTRANPLRAEKPCFGIIAATTPGAFEKILTEHHIRMGFLNRFCFFLGEVKGPIANPKMPDSKAIEFLKQEVNNICEFARELKERIVNEITLSPEAAGMWEKYYNELFYEKKPLSELEIGISERTHVFARKFAVLYTISEKRNVIDIEDLYKACLVADYLKATALYLVGKLGESKYTRLEERILKHLRLNRGKFFSVSALRKIAGGYYTRYEVLNALSTLVLVGDVKKRTQKETPYYGVL